MLLNCGIDGPSGFVACGTARLEMGIRGAGGALGPTALFVGD